MKKPLLILIPCIVVVALVLLQMWLPKRVERELKDAYANSGLKTGKMGISIKSFPSIEMLFGKVDRLHVELHDIESEVSIESAKIDLMGISFSTWELLSKSEFAITSIRSGSGKVIMTEDALNAYLARTPDIGKHMKVALNNGIVSIKGTYSLGDYTIGVTVDGSFSPSGLGISFIPSRLKVLNADIPRFITDQLSSQFDLRIPLGELPFPLEVSKVFIKGGLLIIDVAVPHWGSGYGGSNSVKAY